MSNEGAAQKTFDDIVSFLLKQGELGVSVGGQCRYRQQKGGRILKCAAGSLIPDNLYDSYWDEGGGVPFANIRSLHQKMEDMGYDVDTIENLQTIHDNVGNDAGTIEVFLNRAKRYADHEGLEWKFGQ